VSPARREPGDLPAVVQEQPVAASALERLGRGPPEELAIEFRRSVRVAAREVDQQIVPGSCASIVGIAFPSCDS